MTYTETFYDTIRPGCQSSAAVIVPALQDLYAPTSVLDIGCGEGWFCTAWANAGVPVVIGVDGSYVPDRLDGDVIGVAGGVKWRFLARDLEQPDAFDDVPGGFDLVTCFEVAEHLGQERAAGLVAELCDRAPTVAFSAAIPGQGGAGHVNEQWPGYWADLFAEHGYGLDDAEGDLRMTLWHDERVEPWYRQNLLVFSLGVTPSQPAALVHPVIYDARRAR